MKIAPVKTPWLAKRIFPNYVWSVATDQKELYLTFDDGPTPEVTDFVLEQLAEYHAKATFFCIGNNVEKHPDLFNKTIAAGHSIGNHTQEHFKGWKTSAQAYLKGVEKAEQAFKQAQMTTSSSTGSKLFRPPYGQIKRSQGRQLIALDYKIIMWDVLSFDWDHSVSEDKCLKNVIQNSVAGSIVVFHDSVKASRNMQYALPKVLDYFSNEGFVFKGLPPTMPSIIKS